MLHSTALLQVILALGTLLGSIEPVSASVVARGGREWSVCEGQSIQAVINKANPGDRIVVDRGTYPEQLVISKDNIELVGKNAVLVPPTPLSKNVCTGMANNDTQPVTNAGICIAPKDMTLGPFDIDHRKPATYSQRVKGVSVRGFEVRDFYGLNIAVAAAQGTTITRNKLVNGAFYGALSAASLSSTITDNKVSSGSTAPKPMRYIGICMDDTPGVKVFKNDISGYTISLCVQTPKAEITDNDVRNTCIGAFVDPGIQGAMLRKNNIKGSNQECFNNDGFFGFYGVVMFGASGTQITNNNIEGFTAFGVPKVPATAIAIFDTPPGPGIPSLVATGNVVTNNKLRKNDLDFYVLSAGTNTIAPNDCGGACSTRTTPL